MPSACPTATTPAPTTGRRCSPPPDAAADGDFTLVTAPTAPEMWAYKGMPLYLWVKDTKPGDTTGDGVGGTWHTAVEGM